MSLRPVKHISESQPTTEGAGVHLRRAFGFGKTQEFDPFLLFDDFRNDRPDDYLAGFPWHPHRGIETITVSFVLLINERLARDEAGASWAVFAAANPDLLSWKPSVLDRYYTKDTLDSAHARRGFVMPDRLESGAVS